jgi:hypothetical protein
VLDPRTDEVSQGAAFGLERFLHDDGGFALFI